MDPVPVPCHLPCLGHAFRPRGARLAPTVFPKGCSRWRCSGRTCPPVPGEAGGLRGGPGTAGEPAREVARMLRG